MGKWVTMLARELFGSLSCDIPQEVDRDGLVMNVGPISCPLKPTLTEVMDSSFQVDWSIIQAGAPRLGSHDLEPLAVGFSTRPRTFL